MRITFSNQLRKRVDRMMLDAQQRGDLGSLTRILAVSMVERGNTVCETAFIVGKSQEAVRGWVKKCITFGPKSLDVKKRPGRPPKLTKSQRKELAKLIDHGPKKCGFTQGGWKSSMIQELIRDRFGVLYAVNYICQLLKNMGFSFQKAKFASDHHSKKKRSDWINNKWPKILKEAEKKGAYILFGDEASFPQWGSLSYTWARKGKQPTVKTSGLRRGYKVFGLIEYFTGKFFCKAHDKRLDAQSYADFLTMVMKKTKKHLIIIQDGARYHTCEDMMVFFYENKHRITVYQLPTYSPDYNPIEQLWRKIKREGVHLKYFPTFEDLKDKVDELLIEFGQAKKEVLSLFGLYNKLAENIA